MPSTSSALTEDQRKRRVNRPGGGPYSRRIARGLIDGRTSVGRIASHLRHDLIKEVGGRPNFRQKMLIEQVTLNGVLLSQWATVIERGELVGTQHAHDRYIAASNAFRLGLVALGLQDDARPSINDA